VKQVKLILPHRTDIIGRVSFLTPVKQIILQYISNHNILYESVLPELLFFFSLCCVTYFFTVVKRTSISISNICSHSRSVNRTSIYNFKHMFSPPLCRQEKCSIHVFNDWVLTLPEHLSSPPVFSGVRVTRSLALFVCFVDCCVSFCTFFFSPLCCLFFFDIRILITPLVSSNSSSYCLIFLSPRN